MSLQVGAKTAPSASPRNLLEVQLFMSYPRLTELETLGGAQKYIFC